MQRDHATALFALLRPKCVVHLVVRNDFSDPLTGIRLVHRRSLVWVPWHFDRVASLEARMKPKAAPVSPVGFAAQIRAATRTLPPRGLPETHRPTARLFRPCRSSRKTCTLRQINRHWRESRSTVRSSERLDSYHHRS
jgi:hypothetical protein